MNKYIVAHFNAHSGELLQEEVEANSKVEALVEYLEYPGELPTTLADIEEYCANTDQWATAIQVGSFVKKIKDGYPWPFPGTTLHVQ